MGGNDFLGNFFCARAKVSSFNVESLVKVSDESQITFKHPRKLLALERDSLEAQSFVQSFADGINVTTVRSLLSS